MSKIILPLILVLITDYCNQSCPFCFARVEMKSPVKKEISIEDFKMIVKKCQQAGVLRIALEGGEPMIHSKIEQILKLSLDSFIHVHINTNGIFSDQVEQILYGAGHRVSLFFNISTPGFVFNKNVRALVMKRIKKLCQTCPTTLVITSKFFHEKDAKDIINLIDKNLIKRVTIRLGVEGVIAGERNYSSISDFPRIGNNFFKVFRYVENLSPSLSIVLSKSIVPCMFTEEQRNYLKSKGFLKQFHCHPESEGVWFSITPSLDTFMCYPLSTSNRFKIAKDSSFINLRDYYQNIQKKHDEEFALPECKKCQFFGLKEGKCPGPCLGFKINAYKLSS